MVLPEATPSAAPLLPVAGGRGVGLVRAGSCPPALVAAGDGAVSVTVGGAGVAVDGTGVAVEGADEGVGVAVEVIVGEQPWQGAGKFRKPTSTGLCWECPRPLSSNRGLPNRPTGSQRLCTSNPVRAGHP